LEGLACEPPTGALVFATAAWGPGLGALVEAVGDELGDCPMVGTSVAGLFASGKGTAENPGLGIAVFSGLEFNSVLLDDLDLNDPESGREILDHLIAEPGPSDVLMLLADLRLQSPEPLLAGVASRQQEALVMGLGASPLLGGSAALWRDREFESKGLVATVLRGAAKTRFGVAQGCRAVSGGYEVTRSRDRWISTLDGIPAESVLREAAERTQLPASAESLRQLLVEVVPGDVATPAGDAGVLHNIVGIDPRRSAILLPEEISPGTRVRFALRDAVAARENLEVLVAKHIAPQTAFGFYTAGSSLDRAGQQGAGRDARCFHRHNPDVPILGVRGAQALGPNGSGGSRSKILSDSSLLTTFEN